MNENIKIALRGEIDRRRLTQKQLAKDLGMAPQYLTEMLDLDKGNVPRRWQQLLDALDLELYVRPKDKSLRDDI